MRPELKKEFTDYTVKLKKREEEINKLLENKKLWFKINEEEIEKKIHAKAIDELNNKGFKFYTSNLDYYKHVDRLTDRSLLRIRDGILRRRRYKHKYWYDTSMIPLENSIIEEILPEGFDVFTQQIAKIIKAHNAHEEKYHDEIKVNMDIECIHNEEITQVKVQKIELNGQITSYSPTDKFKISIGTDPFFINWDDLLYDDDFYNHCLNLIKKTDKLVAKAKAPYTKAMNDINEVFKNYKKILVVERLKGNDQK